MALEQAYVVAKEATDYALKGFLRELEVMHSFNLPQDLTINTFASSLPAEVYSAPVKNWPLYLILGNRNQPQFLVSSDGRLRETWCIVHLNLERYATHRWLDYFLKRYPAIETKAIPPNKLGYSFTLIRLQ